MEYKVTALRDITIRAYVRSQTPVDYGGHIFMKPDERQEWVSLRAGEVRDGLGLVIGIHPSCIPDETPTHVTGVAMILTEGWSNDQLPKEFFGLYRLEVSGHAPTSGAS
jgi:hypothetical protein